MKPTTCFLSLLGLAVILILLGHGPQASPGPKNLSKLVPTASTIKTFNDVAKPRLADTYGKLPLSFEANQGHSDRRVKFLSHGAGYTLFLTPTEAVLALSKPQAQTESNDPIRSRFLQGEKTITTALHIKLVGANPKPPVDGVDELPGKSNYFIGNDPNKWRTNVPTYAKVHYRGVYPGVDLVYYGNQRQLEHDFIVAPGTDPRCIRLSLDGAGKVSLSAQGDLVLQLPGGELRLERPMLYQEEAGARRKVTGGYVLLGGKKVGFDVGAYDRNRPLVIDPTLAYSTYLGGSSFDRGAHIVVDSAGNAYVTGPTSSSNFPTTTGAFQTTFGGQFDVYVTKLNSSGSALVYSTYLGGNDLDFGDGLAVDSAGNAYVSGQTNSSNFPTTTGAFQTTSGGGSSDGFVTKLNSSGSALVYSTRLGGNGGARCDSIALDSAGNAYVTGLTNSSNFPTTTGAFQTTYGGSTDAFVTKLNSSGSALVYSTYLGGSGVEEGYGIAVDLAGNAYVTGYTTSSNFPTTTGAYQTTFGGSADAFVTKLNSSGSALVYSTYLGGGSDDQGNGIALDSAANAYVGGTTTSTNFPTTTGAFQTTSGGSNDAFVTKLNSSGSALLYSTYLGGSGSDTNGNGLGGIAVDSAGNAYVIGTTTSTNFPTTTGAFQTTFGGGQSDAFVTKLNSSGSALVYSTYLGGSGLDQASGIAVDSAANAYVLGETESSNFPTTTGAFQTSLGGSRNAFVAKIANIACSPQGDDVEGDGDEQGDDGHVGHFHFCNGTGDMEFEERDSGKGMKGRMDAVTISGNRALIIGRGTLLDGTPLYYAAVVLGNAPVIGANHFAIAWITSKGSSFHTSGPLIAGHILVLKK